MGCGNSKSKTSIKKPYVTKSSVPDNVSYVSRDNIPPGAVLTGAAKLHNQGITGKGMRVSVIDSGVDKDHEAFHGMVKKQKWYRHGSSLAKDDHGTHVAGTIHFIAPDAEIYDYRVFGDKGNVGVTKAIENAILQSITDKCHIINMSLGGPVPNPGIQKAIKKAVDAGIVVVCAAGNEGDGNPLTNEISYPASFTECLSIAALGKENGLPVAKFSNSNVEVDYSGIGVDVISMKPFGGYQKMSGTSMACPHVCGFITAIMSMSSNNSNKKSVDDIRAKITDKYTIDIGVKGKDNATGLGFVTYLSEDELTNQFRKEGYTISMAKVY